MNDSKPVHFWTVENLYKRCDGKFYVTLKSRGGSCIEREVTPSEAMMIDIGMMLGIDLAGDCAQVLHRPIMVQEVITKVVPLSSKETDNGQS